VEAYLPHIKAPSIVQAEILMKVRCPKLRCPPPTLKTLHLNVYKAFLARFIGAEQMPDSGKSSPPRALRGVETATFFSFLIPVIHERYPPGISGKNDNKRFEE
jgi:hypothetical protein